MAPTHFRKETNPNGFFFMSITSQVSDTKRFELLWASMDFLDETFTVETFNSILKFALYTFLAALSFFSIPEKYTISDLQKPKLPDLYAVFYPKFSYKVFRFQNYHF